MERWNLCGLWQLAVASLNQEHAEFLPRQVAGERTAAGAGADDDEIVLCGFIGCILRCHIEVLGSKSPKQIDEIRTFLIGERRAEIVALVHDIVGALAELMEKAA